MRSHNRENDVGSDRYQLLRTGWQGDRRVFEALINIDLED